MTFPAHTCTRTRMQTAVNWRQTAAFKPEARQDKESIILISAKSATSRTTTTMTRRPTKSKSKPHAKRIRFRAFSHSANANEQAEKEQKKHNGKKFTWLDFRRFPPRVYSPLSDCIVDHNCSHWRRRWKLFKLLPKYFGLTSMLANWRVTYISNTCWLRAAQVFALLPFFMAAFLPASCKCRHEKRGHKAKNNIAAL